VQPCDGRLITAQHRLTNRRLLAGLLCAGAITAALPAAAHAALDDTLLVSRSGIFGAKANGTSAGQSISADGRFVAFRSDATNLSPDDPDATIDVYVRDLQRNTTTLVSRATGPAGAKGNAVSTAPVISADGRFVAFESDATNLDIADTNTATDVYVRDLQDGTTTYVSRASGPAGAGANAMSVSPSISGDGRRVAFLSTATNLSPNDTDTGSDVFVRDLEQSTTTVASRATGPGGAKGDNSSSFPAISLDGRRVAFASFSSNLHPDDTDFVRDVFVRDLDQATTFLASRATGPAGAKGNGAAIRPRLSGDGRLVTFESTATNMSPDDTDTAADVYVRDLQQGTTTLASRASGPTGAKGNATAAEPAISANGRYVAFHTSATNLHPDDTDAVADVFVRDLRLDTTALASRAGGPGAAKGNDFSLVASLSADGRYVAFRSLATNMHPSDTDALNDVYVRDLLAPETIDGARVTGRAVDGDVLTCSPGAYGNGPVSVALQWLRGGTAIPGAGGSSYTLVPGDIGQAISCLAVATNRGGSTASESAPVVAQAKENSGPAGAGGPAGPAGSPGAPGAAARLFVALAQVRLTVRSGRAATVRYVATAGGAVSVRLTRSGRTVTTIARSARAGRNSLKLPARVRRPGGRRLALAAGRYRLRLTLRDASGRTAADSARLVVTRRR
jgi:Tol biopolymer transport system component